MHAGNAKLKHMYATKCTITTLTTRAQSDLLQLINLLPSSTAQVHDQLLVPSTVYELQKGSKTTSCFKQCYHYYCPDCYTILSDSTTATCPTEGCKAAFSSSIPFFHDNRHCQPNDSSA